MRAKKLADLRALEAERFVGELEKRVYAAEQRALQSEHMSAQLNQLRLQRDFHAFQSQQLQAELAHTLQDMSVMAQALEKQFAFRQFVGRFVRPLRFVYRSIFPKKGVPAQQSENQTHAPAVDLEPALTTAPLFLAADATKPHLLIVAANPDQHPLTRSLLSCLPTLQTQYNLVVLLLDADSLVSTWAPFSTHVLVAPEAKGAYIETKERVQALAQAYPLNAALLYGMQTKTALDALAGLSVPTLSFMDYETAQLSSQFGLQEIFYVSTATVLENAAVQHLCVQAFPQINQQRLPVLPLDPTTQPSWWLSQLSQMRDAYQQHTADAQLLLESDQFDASFVEADAERQQDKAKLVNLYLYSWKAQLQPRKPCAGFQPAIYAQHQLSAPDSTDPFAHYLRHNQPQGPWNYPVITVDDHAPRLDPACTQPVALHIHAYYPDMVPDILARLAFNTRQPDLFISVKSAADAAQVQASVGSYKGKVVAITTVPNVGRDIGPFLTAFGSELVQNYAFIGHVHTKKSLHVVERTTVDVWQSFLLTGLLGDGQQYAMADVILARMQAQPELGIVFPDDPKVLGWDRNRSFAELMAPELGVHELPQHFNFPAGNMFWVRAEVLARFVALNLDWDHYPTEPLGNDATMLHAIERLFGVVPEAMGLSCGVSALRGVTR